jgi:DNA excision repair protein ERCC-3
MEYAVAEARHKFRIASENPGKLRLVRQLLERHRDVPVLIIGMYVAQVEGFARELGLPLLSGATNQAKRDAVYEQFRRGEIRALVVSKIANFSVDLPDAAVAIQVSGMFGSRQEEAQWLGRILRPKPGENQAHFYSIVSRDTVEQDFALNRQLFLCEHCETHGGKGSGSVAPLQAGHDGPDSAHQHFVSSSGTAARSIHVKCLQEHPANA